MDTITLNHEQYLQFTGWSANHFTKQTQATRTAKLEKMGVTVLAVNGKGTKADYIISIPSTFWRMFIVQDVTYSALGADYMNMLIESKDVVNTDEGIFIQFHTEMYKGLISKHNAEENTVKSTCSRIRTFLNDHDLIKVGNEVDDVKSHRVKKNDKWVTGTEAVLYDQQARNVWRNFFTEKEAIYFEAVPGATELPLSIFGAEMKQLFGFGMKERLNVDVYRVAKRTLPTQNLITDINEMRLLFLQTSNLALVKEELTRRQAHYKAQKERKQERVKAAQAKAVKENHISKDKCKEIEAKMKKIESFKGYVPPTEDQLRKRELYLDALMLDLVPNQLGGNDND